ncbi:putative nitric oxide reductase, cytochrome b subunit [Pyrodictium delaneyi]|uniref:Nitric-oxide reductase large subunit n=1 Tax=Pyrodictium delaneyi TaxID=1273541 RepID=A0A0N7JD68_9CREN|nr:nitric-oxide reductase large subunit [Pyrodictium delaneyi]ALL01353.1 putative nitric oxide reductase, cytochrome b subunit [Pyrodictium delaneyi]OWJ53816.1 nitric-oxide reductase large subunit [Pyrodictium delaneyi]
MKNGFTKLVLVAAILVYIVYGVMAFYTFQNLPPIPDKVVTETGELLFTGQDVVDGKVLVQRYGLQDYGSFLGFGGYFGMDYTAYTLHILAETAKEAGIEDLKAALEPRFEQQGGETIAVVSDVFAEGYRRALDFYTRFFRGEITQETRLAPLDLTPDEAKKITAFFTWGAMIAIKGYTNGFPYYPGLVEPTISSVKATWVTIFLLLLVVMPLVGYVLLKFIDYWRDRRVTVELPPPSRAQRLALVGMALAALGLAVQGLLGGYMMHLYAEQTLYGVDLTGILPFNVARALHYNLAILWIVVTWVSFAIFILPYFGAKITEKHALAILGAGAVTALGILFGIWLTYLGKMPDSIWFILGSQGRPVISQGTLWLLLVAGLLTYLALVVYRTAKTTPLEPARPLLKILAIGLAGAAAGAFVGALPIVRPWSHFTVDEYFRWITIHSFVEGFWPAILVPILVALLIVTGLVPPKLGIAVAGMDAALEIATGMIGTAHHYYWGGEPTFWMYVGAAMSTLEVLPIGFLIAYAIVLWRRGEMKTELQKTLVTFILVAALGGAIGVIAFGAGLINMPVVNYYLHGSQGTMVHAHLAMPLAYGIPSILMWVVAFYLAGGFSDTTLRKLRKAAIVMAIGFYLQILVSLGPLMLKQFDAGSSQGYWFIKSLVTPDGSPGFWMDGTVKALVWARLLGDLVVAAALLVFLVEIAKALPRALKS